MCFSIPRTCGKHFLPPAGCGSIFPAKSYQDAWRSGSQLARGQVNMVDETKLHSPVHWTFEVLAVQYAVRYCGVEELGPFWWPVLAAALQFLVYLINWLNILLRCNGFTRILKAVVHQTGKEIRKESGLSVMSDSVTPWTVAYQAPLSMGFSRQEYWSGVPFPSPGDLLNPGIEPRTPVL